MAQALPVLNAHSSNMDILKAEIDALSAAFRVYNASLDVHETPWDLARAAYNNLVDFKRMSRWQRLRWVLGV